MTASHDAAPPPSFVVREWTLEPSDGFQVQPHVHHSSEEAFYVLEGRLAVMFGDEERRFGPGELAMVQRGTRHTFRAEGDGPTRVLAVLTPEVDRLITALHQPGMTPAAIDAAWKAGNSERA